MNNLELTVTRGRTEPLFYGPRDCRAHIRGRSSFDRTTAVSPRHAEPLHPHVRLQRQRLASNARWNALSEAQASISRTAAPYPIYTLPVALYFLPKSQGKSSLLLGLGIGTGVLEKHEDVAGSIGSSYRLGEGTITGVGGRGRSSAML
jgi:hypothetical protein